MPPALRRVLVLLYVVMLVQETNLGSLFVGAECFETCADDFAPGHCSPVCASCSCGTQANPVAPRVTRLPAPELRANRLFHEAAAPLSDTYQSDILHVPKRFVA